MKKTAPAEPNRDGIIYNLHIFHKQTINEMTHAATMIITSHACHSSVIHGPSVLDRYVIIGMVYTSSKKFAPQGFRYRGAEVYIRSVSLSAESLARFVPPASAEPPSTPGHCAGCADRVEEEAAAQNIFHSDRFCLLICSSQIIGIMQ